MNPGFTPQRDIESKPRAREWAFRGPLPVAPPSHQLESRTPHSHYAWLQALIRAIDQREPTLRGCLSPCAIAFEVTRPEPRRAPFDGGIALTVGAVGETMLAMARNPWPREIQPLGPQLRPQHPAAVLV